MRRTSSVIVDGGTAFNAEILSAQPKITRQATAKIFRVIRRPFKKSGRARVATFSCADKFGYRRRRHFVQQPKITRRA
ncbi:MAG: hypothetical protein IJ774_04100, partial [Selenomonadaceae bacterium]|nr:hypothetical protein [Selenomonadaceae bacterium]